MTTITELNLCDDDVGFVDRIKVPFTAGELRGLISGMTDANAAAFLEMFTREKPGKPVPILTAENAAAFLELIDKEAE